ncbi:MAG: hypothetical protein GXO81_04680 [Chlorobi bacterium]|nr:hypothetical protein [Chlorobiota bacterium]
METSLLYTLPQWGIFVGVAMVIYSWVEKKKAIGMVGLSVLVLLGIYATYAIKTGWVSIEFNASGKLPNKGFSSEGMPIEVKLAPVYWGLVAVGILSLISLTLELTVKKLSGVFKAIASIVALALFFMVYGIIKL